MNIITQPQVVSIKILDRSKLLDKIVNDDRAPLTSNAVAGTNNVNYEPCPAYDFKN